MTHTLALATQNRGKVEELRVLLAGLDVDVVPMKDLVRPDFHVIEDGATFEENALKKARAVAQATMMLTLADDSGLEVDALNGAPGVRSARYASERATDAENNAALLSALESTPNATGDAPARFRCVLALIDPFVCDGEPYIVEGVCEGKITRTPRGSGGFGYDPLFLVEGTDKTMAELSEEEKNRISHRSKAMTKLRLTLETVLAARDSLTRRVTG